MADIRFKDLTTTASSTASDDFIAVDGTTNGTRKLSAFSPTFGGDPVVTGTLTVNGTSLANGLVVNGNGIALNTAGSASIRFQDSGTSKWWFYKLSADPNLYVRDMVNGRMQALFTPGATSGVATTAFYSTVTIDATTASTTTSSGALVVGNGTSGGLGVGGAINAGGAITSNNGSGSGLLGMRSSSGNASYVFWSETSVADRGILGFNNGSSTLSYRSGASSFSTGTEVFSITSGGNVTAIGATHSLGTSASSGTSLKVISGVGTLAAPKYSTLDFRNYNDLKTGAYIRTGNRESDTNEWLLEIATRSNADVLTQIATFSDTKLSILASTNSTTTSSGALVVSGGVGVAGAIYAGGLLSIGRSAADTQAIFGDGSRDTNIQMKSTGNVTSNVLAFDSGVRLTIGATTPMGAYVTVYNGVGINKTAPTEALDVVGNGLFSGTVKTGAPSGGTAAAWKLGTVASVSPTSPNRTIEVDIGGTIYYIHAKTTNN